MILACAAWDAVRATEGGMVTARPMGLVSMSGAAILGRCRESVSGKSGHLLSFLFGLFANRPSLSCSDSIGVRSTGRAAGLSRKPICGGFVGGATKNRDLQDALTALNRRR